MKQTGNQHARNLLILLVLPCMALLTNACMKSPLLVCHPNYFHNLDKDAMNSEIIRHETTIGQYPDNPAKSASYFYLALLYAHYNNPQPDYSRSLAMFEKYLLFNPDSQKRDEVQYLQTLLRKLVETGKERALMNNEAKTLKQNNEKLKDNNEKLVAENQNLTNAIEKLQLLDLTLEEKRLKY